MRSLDLIGGTEIMSTEDCWEFLAGHQIGRVAEFVYGRVEIFPVNYGLDADGIIFRTNLGTKLAGTIGKPVAFEVDQIDLEVHAGSSVVVHGEVHDISALDNSECRQTAESWAGQKDYLLKIRPTVITGRRVRPL